MKLSNRRVHSELMSRLPPLDFCDRDRGLGSIRAITLGAIMPNVFPVYQGIVDMIKSCLRVQ